MVGKAIQRLEDIEKSENIEVLILSAEQNQIKEDLKGKIIDQLIPILTQAQIDDTLYLKANTILDQSQSKIKELL